jgi:hypothetical protein
MLCIGYYEACQRKNRANSWNDCHSPLAGRRRVSTASAEKNLLGFRARASRISSLASGRGGPRYCGGQQSGLKKRLSSPTGYGYYGGPRGAGGGGGSRSSGSGSGSSGSGSCSELGVRSRSYTHARLAHARLSARVSRAAGAEAEAEVEVEVEAGSGSPKFAAVYLYFILS